MHVFKFVTFLILIYSQWDFGVDSVAVEIDLRLTPDQKKVMDKVICTIMCFVKIKIFITNALCLV